MRIFLAGTLTVLGLLFGGIGVANATPVDNGAAPATSTTLVAVDDQNDDSGNNGLWGLVGLLGLAGLAGLMPRRNTAGRGTAPGGTLPPQRG